MQVHEGANAKNTRIYYVKNTLQYYDVNKLVVPTIIIASVNTSI